MSHIDRLRGRIPVSTLREPKATKDDYENPLGGPGNVVKLSYGIGRGREDSDVSAVRATWRRHQDGLVVRRVTRAMNRNRDGVDPDRTGRIGEAGELTQRLQFRGMGISEPRSAHVLTDSQTGETEIYIGTNPSVHHPDISITAPEVYRDVYGSKSRRLDSGHIASVRLAGHEAVVFSDDRIYRLDSGRFDRASVELAKELGKHGIIVVSSDGDVVE